MLTPREKRIQRRDKRRKERRQAQADAAIAREKEKTKRQKQRQKTLRELGKGAGSILKDSQEFTQSQIQQVRDRGAASQAHIQSEAPGLAAAYLGMNQQPAAQTGQPAAQTGTLPDWVVPAAAVGGVLYFATRKG